MYRYPKVRDEFATIRKVVEGKSLARLGDGELKHAGGAQCQRQVHHDDLTSELRTLLKHPHKDCLVGIPTMNPRGPKYENWIRHEKRFQHFLSPKVQYYSSFVTRPDSAPWIENQEFVNLFQSVWSGRLVVVIAPPTSKVPVAARYTARSVIHYPCDLNAYKHIDEFEKKTLLARPEVALLSIGVTATILANRLAARGIQAIDIGSAGAFLCRWIVA